MQKALRLVFTLSAVILLFALNLSGQPGLLVGPMSSPDTLARAIMGDKVSISNIYYRCPQGASGVALGTNSNLPFDTAVVLSNGNVQSAMGPNFNPATSDFFNAPGDTFLSNFGSLPQIPTHDACILQFDFVPLSSPLRLDYVFASDEYPEYVCCPTADRFGFFLTGPNPNPLAPAYNITPFTNIPNVNPPLPVLINSVNPGSVGSQPCVSGAACLSLNFAALYNDNSGSLTEEVDGYTNSLPAPALVYPCSTYTLRLAIADGGGPPGPTAQEVNSYVFIESTPTSGTPIQAEFSTYQDVPYLIEGCFGGNLILGVDTVNPFPQSFILEHIGTAENNVDYSLPDTVTIPANQQSVNIPFTPFNDTLVEPNDTIKLGIRLPCSNIFQTISIPIKDSLELTAAPDTTICPGDTISLRANTEGEVVWSPGYNISDTTIKKPLIFPAVDTTYTVEAGIFQCTSVTSVDINLYPAPSVDAGEDTTICVGQPLILFGSVGNNANAIWDPDPSLLNPSSQVTPVSPSDSNTYILNAIDNKGCTNEDTVDVYVNQLPALDVGGQRAICKGDTTKIDISGEGNFHWEPENTVVDPNVQDAEVFNTSLVQYTITATDSNGCQRQQILFVIPVDPPDVDAGPDIKTCPNDTVNLEADGALYYSWQPKAFLSDSTGDNAKVQAFPPNTTNFIVTGEDFRGCKGKDTVQVETTPPPPITATANKTSACPGDTIKLTANGQGIAYKWSPATNLVNPDSATTAASVDSNITFTVQITDSIGCHNYDSISITVNQVPSINTGMTDTICRGSSIQLNASGGVDYNWSPSASLSNAGVKNPVASPTTTTTYTLEVTNSAGCTGTDSTIIEVLSLPNANAGPDIDLCSGDTSMLNASGGTLYNWSPSKGLGCDTCASTKVSLKSAQIYTLQVTDQLGCKNTDSVKVDVLSLPQPNPSTDNSEICFGESVNLTTSNFVDYQWEPSSIISNPNIQNPSATPDTTTNFTVSVTDANGCTGVDSVLVEVFGLPNAIGGGNDSICKGESLQLTASGGTSFEWSPGTTLSDSTISNPVATPDQTTTYSLKVTNNLGCESNDEITITVLDLPNVDAGQNKDVCMGDTVTLSATGASWYVWSPAAKLSCDSCTSPKWAVNTTTNFNVIGYDNNGCAQLDSVTYTAKPRPSVTAKPDTTICPDEPVQLESSGGVNYQWSPANGLNNPNISKPVATPGDPVTYSVLVTDSDGCKNVDSVRIDFFPNSNVNAGEDTAMCKGQSVILNGSGTSNYSWQPAGSINDPDVANPEATPESTTTYTVTGSSNNGCESTDVVTVKVNSLPEIQANKDSNFICPGSQSQINLSGAANYEWSPSNGISDPNSGNPDIFPSNTTMYTIVGSSAEGCKDSINVYVEVLPFVNPSASPDSASICLGDSVQLMALENYSYNWKPNEDFIDHTVASPVAIPQKNETYTVEVTDNNGCKFTDSVHVMVHPSANADAGMDRIIYKGGSVVLNGSGNGSLLWKPDKWLEDPPTKANPKVTPDSNITYTLQVTTSDGCTATDKVFINVLLETGVEFPNAFTPNGDGRNDYFGPKIFNEIEIEYFRIYNRWGEVVFSTTDPNEKWDGTVAGEDAPVGTYVYQFKGIGNYDKVITKQGNITLIR